MMMIIPLKIVWRSFICLLYIRLINWVYTWWRLIIIGVKSSNFGSVWERGKFTCHSIFCLVLYDVYKSFVLRGLTFLWNVLRFLMRSKVIYYRENDKIIILYSIYIHTYIIAILSDILIMYHGNAYIL